MTKREWEPPHDTVDDAYDVEAFLIQSGYGWYLDRHYAAIGAMLRDGKA